MDQALLLKFNGQYFLDILEEIRMNVYPNGHAQRTARKILHLEICPSNHSQKVKDYIEATIQLLNPNRKKLELFYNWKTIWCKQRNTIQYI